MDYRDQVLQTIYAIVKEDASPFTYPIKPRELILRLQEDWSLIYEQLVNLQEEGLVELKQLDTLVIYITQKGIILVQPTLLHKKRGSFGG